MSYYERHIFICMNQKIAGKPCCANKGGKPYAEYLKEKLTALNMHGAGKIRVSQSGCLGRCAQGPCLLIYPEGIWYTYESFDDLDEVIESDLIHHRPVERLLIEKLEMRCEK